MLTNGAANNFLTSLLNKIELMFNQMLDLFARAFSASTYGRTIDDVMAIKPKFLASMGYHIFFNYGAPRSYEFRVDSIWITLHNTGEVL